MGRVPAFLEAANLFVFPSRLEGMPNSILEAWAAGLPVVAVDTPAHREIFRDGAGFLYTDRAELKAHVATLLDDPGAAKAMGTVGRQHVVDHFSMEAASQRYLELYTRVLAQGATRRGEAPASRVDLG
jgi:glycosyltransferase involved in cell wall biosynthesis